MPPPLDESQGTEADDFLISSVEKARVAPSTCPEGLHRLAQAFVSTGGSARVFGDAWRWCVEWAVRDASVPASPHAVFDAALELRMGDATIHRVSAASACLLDACNAGASGAQRAFQGLWPARDAAEAWFHLHIGATALIGVRVGDIASEIQSADCSGPAVVDAGLGALGVRVVARSPGNASQTHCLPLYSTHDVWAANGTGLVAHRYTLYSGPIKLVLGPRASLEFGPSTPTEAEDTWDWAEEAGVADPDRFGPIPIQVTFEARRVAAGSHATASFDQSRVVGAPLAESAQNVDVEVGPTWVRFTVQEDAYGAAEWSGLVWVDPEAPEPLQDAPDQIPAKPPDDEPYDSPFRLQTVSQPLLTGLLVRSHAVHEVQITFSPVP